MSKMESVKRMMKMGMEGAKGAGEVGMGMMETFGRRAMGNEGVSKIGKRGVGRLQAIKKAIKGGNKYGGK